MKKVPDSYIEYPEEIMSNFDHKIELDIVDHIKGKLLFSGYPGWDFYGDVWFEDNKWHCQVKSYSTHVATYSSENIEDLKEQVCSNHGYE